MQRVAGSVERRAMRQSTDVIPVKVRQDEQGLPLLQQVFPTDVSKARTGIEEDVGAGRPDEKRGGIAAVAEGLGPPTGKRAAATEELDPREG